MTTISESEVRSRLSELLAAAENGEETMITKYGRPIAKLVPVREFDRARAREAAEWLIEFSKKHSLGGVKLKDLINEGRRY